MDGMGLLSLITPPSSVEAQSRVVVLRPLHLVRPQLGNKENNMCARGLNSLLVGSFNPIQKH